MQVLLSFFVKKDDGSGVGSKDMELTPVSMGSGRRPLLNNYAQVIESIQLAL